MRLIDADEVINIAKNTYTEEDVLKIAWLLCHTPTAYDVEKVVVEVEKYFDDEIGKWVKGTEPLELYEYKKDVPNIVRKDGVE